MDPNCDVLFRHHRSLVDGEGDIVTLWRSTGFGLQDAVATGFDQTVRVDVFGSGSFHHLVEVHVQLGQGGGDGFVGRQPPIAGIRNRTDRLDLRSESVDDGDRHRAIVIRWIVFIVDAIGSDGEGLHVSNLATDRGRIGALVEPIRGDVLRKFTGSLPVEITMLIADQAFQREDITLLAGVLHRDGEGHLVLRPLWFGRLRRQGDGNRRQTVHDVGVVHRYVVV